VQRLDALAFDQTLQQADRHPAHLRERLPDGRQLWRHDLRRLDVVEADDRQVVGDAQAAFATGLNCADRDVVVEREDRGRRLRQVQQLSGGPHAGADLEIGLDDERGLGELCALGQKEPELQLADLSWLGISPLRGMCAALFDPPRDPSVLLRLDRVRVVSNIQGTQARGLLALGWLMARLGWKEPKRLEEAKGTRRWQATRQDGKPVMLELSTQPGGTHGVAALELHAGDAVWSLKRDSSIHVQGPDMPSRSQPARSHSDAELLASALGSRGRDTMFRDALSASVELVNK